MHFPASILAFHSPGCPGLHPFKIQTGSCTVLPSIATAFRNPLRVINLMIFLGCPVHLIAPTSLRMSQRVAPHARFLML
jgi:hypothetical protein